MNINNQTTQETLTSKQKTNTTQLYNEEELRPENGSTKIQVLKVYQTDEENYEKYRSGEENLNGTTNSEFGGDIEEENETDSETFKLHQGEIQTTYLYNQLFELSFNRDYENPTGQGKIKLKYQDEDLKKLYKGQRLELKTGREKKNTISKTELENLIKERKEELEKEYLERKNRVIKQHQEVETKNKENIEKEKENNTTGVKIPEFTSTTVLNIVNNKDTEDTIKEKENLNKLGIEQSTISEEIKKSIEKQAENEVLGELTGLETSILGWITEENITNDGLELGLQDYGKLLESNDKLSYKNMYRSQILEEVIKTAGLEPIVDFTGLQDDVISWTSVSTSESEDTGSNSTVFSDCSPIVDMTNKLGCKVSSYGAIPSNITIEMYARIGKSSANYAKGMKGKSAKEVWRACKNGLKYCKYQCNRDKCASTSWNNKSSLGLNCGDSARLLKCCMDIAGHNCIMIHTPGHFYNAVEVDGKWLTADLCYVNNSRGTNQLMA